jgi:hypothetical protein
MREADALGVNQHPSWRRCWFTLAASRLKIFKEQNYGHPKDYEQKKLSKKKKDIDAKRETMTA